MKVTLFTIWGIGNYGAEMQTYATVKALRELGHEINVARIFLYDIERPSIKGRIAKFLQWILRAPCNVKFSNFWDKYIPKGERFRSLDDLRRNPPAADIYLVGSDQVWNPNICKGLISAFLLDFAPVNIKRISYASSFGISNWNESEETTKLFRKNLPLFSFIGCREKTGCEILKRTFNIGATNVLDPTLLHHNYDEITKRVPQEDTLAYYPLHNDPELEQNAISLAKKLDLRAVNINESSHIIKSVIYDRTGIDEWLSGIQRASLVLTRSFHGVALSLVYQKQFIVVNDTGVSSRITDLLEKLNLTSRYFTSFQKMIDAEPWLEPIKYTEVNKKLDVLRETSWNYLKKALEN